MGKVNLTREVAGVIESNRKGGRSDEDIIKLHAGNPQGWLSPVLHDIPLDTLIRALYIGYEVEQTPEEEIRDYYKRMNSISGQRQGIDFVLKVLNIKIPGVNE